MRFAATRPSQLTTGRWTPWRMGFLTQERSGPFANSPGSPASAPSLKRPCWSAPLQGKAAMSHLHPVGQAPAQLIVVGLEGAGWRCRRSAQCRWQRSPEQRQPVKASISAIRPCQRRTRSQAAAQAIRRAVRLTSMPDQRFKAKSETRCGAGSIQPVGAAGVAQAGLDGLGAICSGVDCHASWWRRANVVTPSALPNRPPRSPAPMAWSECMERPPDLSFGQWALILACPRAPASAEVHPSHLYRPVDGQPAGWC